MLHSIGLLGGKARSESYAGGTVAKLTCAEEAQHQLSVLALRLWEQGPDVRAQCDGSAQPQVGTLEVPFNWTFR